jgi:hypothetical protein
VRLARLRTPAKYRRVVDDGTAMALRDQLAQRGPGAAERPGQRDVQHPVPLLLDRLLALVKTIAVRQRKYERTRGKAHKALGKFRSVADQRW